MSLTGKRLDRMTRLIRYLGESAGSEADTVRMYMALTGQPFTIDTIQRDLNHLCNIGLATRTRCCGDPYWFTLTDMGRRIWAAYTPQEA